MYPGATFEPCPEAQVTLEELCTPTPDIVACCPVKTEIPMLEPLHSVPAQDVMAMPACEMVGPALSGWDHFSQGMHWAAELPVPHPAFEYDCDASMMHSETGDISDGLPELHAEPVPTLKTEDDEIDERCQAGLEAALDCLQDDFDALVENLSV